MSQGKMCSSYKYLHSMVIVLLLTSTVLSSAQSFEKVTLKTFATCDQKPNSIQLNDKEVSLQKTGLDVVTIDTKDGTVMSANFDKPMSFHIFHYDIEARMKRRQNFIEFIHGIKNGSVVVMVSQNLCRERNFLDWDYVKRNTNLKMAFTTKSKWRKSVVIACQQDCPKTFLGKLPISLFNQDEIVNITFAIQASTNSDKNDNKQQLTVITISIIIVCLVLILSIIAGIYVMKKKRKQQKCANNEIGDDEERIYQSVEVKPNNTSSQHSTTSTEFLSGNSSSIVTNHRNEQNMRYEKSVSTTSSRVYQQISDECTSQQPISSAYQTLEAITVSEGCPPGFYSTLQRVDSRKPSSSTSEKGCTQHSSVYQTLQPSTCGQDNTSLSENDQGFYSKLQRGDSRTPSSSCNEEENNGCNQHMYTYIDIQLSDNDKQDGSCQSAESSDSRDNLD